MAAAVEVAGQVGGLVEAQGTAVNPGASRTVANSTAPGNPRPYPAGAGQRSRPATHKRLRPNPFPLLTRSVGRPAPFCRSNRRHGDAISDAAKAEAIAPWVFVHTSPRSAGKFPA